MRTTKDLLQYLSNVIFFRELLYTLHQVTNVPEWLQSKIYEQKRLYKLRQSMDYIAICMIERGEY